MTREGYKQAIAYLLDVLPRTDEVVENRLLDDMWNANLRDHVPRKARKTDPTFEKQRRLIDDKKWEEEPESEEEEDQ